MVLLTLLERKERLVARERDDKTIIISITITITTLV